MAEVTVNRGETLIVDAAGCPVQVDAAAGGPIIKVNGKQVYPPLTEAFKGAANDQIPYQPGQLVPGKGVYVGTWEPKVNSGQTLGKIFDLYAAPEDLKGNRGNNPLMTFNDAVLHVAGLRNWHGHDGKNFANEKEVIQAVRTKPELLAKWFIPTREILHGKNAQGTKVQTNNLYDYRTKMPRGAEFVTNAGGSDFAHLYWSCTATHPGSSSDVYTVNFTSGDVGWAAKGSYKLSARPVRAELRL